MKSPNLTVFVCTGPVCGKAGLALARAARDWVAQRPWEDKVHVHREVCLGYCHQGPNVMLTSEPNVWGRAPMAGSAGSESLAGMDMDKLAAAIEARLEISEPGTAGVQDVQKSGEGGKG